jgi:colicin import membrane protein
VKTGARRARGRRAAAEEELQAIEEAEAAEARREAAAERSGRAEQRREEIAAERSRNEREAPEAEAEAEGDAEARRAEAGRGRAREEHKRRTSSPQACPSLWDNATKNPLEREIRRVDCSATGDDIRRLGKSANMCSLPCNKRFSACPLCERRLST